MIPGYQVHIAHGVRVRTKTSSPDKAEAQADSAGIFRDHEVHIARMAKGQIRTSRGVKVEVPADLTGIFRAEDQVNSIRVTRVEVWDNAARASDVKTWCSGNLVPAEAVEVRLFKVEVAEVFKTQDLEYRVEAAEVSRVEAAEVSPPETHPHRTGAWITSRDDPVPEVEADKALVCSRDNSYRIIRIKQISLRRPEVEAGHLTMDQEPDKAGGRTGDRTGRRIGTWSRNRKQLRMPMPQSRRLPKTSRNNRRVNNVENLIQYNWWTILPI
jgi:hypothetical protein